MAVAPEPLDCSLVVRFDAHGVSGSRAHGSIVEAARRGWVVPAPDAAQHLDRVIGLVEPHPGDLDLVLEEGTGRAEGALAPSLLQGLVAVDQDNAPYPGAHVAS